MEKITLIIVDPQYDFIEGGKLPVEGGKKALDNVVKLLDSGKVGQVITTQDWHIGNHCSFKDFGGDFPEHCVENTFGAQIYEPIMTSIYNNNICWIDYYKGYNFEEFTAIKEVDHIYSDYIRFKMSTTRNSNYDLELCKEENIVICGLAGDICVLNTLKAICPYIPVSVYLDGIASIDGGNMLKSFMENNNIKEYGPELA